MARNDQIWKMVRQCLDDGHDWFPDIQDKVGAVPHHVLALCGEVGELANMTKKIQRGTLDPEDEEVMNEFKMELADVFVYLLNIAGLTNTDLAEAYNVKRALNIRRFGSGPRQP